MELHKHKIQTYIHSETKYTENIFLLPYMNEKYLTSKISKTLQIQLF